MYSQRTYLNQAHVETGTQTEIRLLLFVSLLYLEVVVTDLKLGLYARFILSNI